MRDAERSTHFRGCATAGEVGFEVHAGNGSWTPNVMQGPLPLSDKRRRENVRMTDTLQQALGRRLREARKRARLTQEKVGEQLDLSSHSAVGQWERGKTLPDLLNLIYCAEIYSASLDWLVWNMGNGIDARVKKLPDVLRKPLIERMMRDIEDAERLAARLPKAFGAEPVLDDDQRLRLWSAEEKLRQMRERCGQPKSAKRGREGGGTQ